MPPFYQGRWIDQQRALLDIAADYFASDLGLRFGNTCIVPVEAAATDGP